jgi:Domain of unknown function (DUF6434)
MDITDHMNMTTAISMSDQSQDRRPFDWHYSGLASHTIITADYRSTQNVRRFFKAAIGEHFKFDRPFIAWMQDNTGKTLGDAVDEWRKRKGYKE